MSLRDEIRDLIARELAVDTEDVVPEAHLQDDLGADSLMLLNLAEAINARHGTALAIDDLMNMANVSELLEAIESATEAG